METRIITYLLVEDDKLICEEFLEYSAVHKNIICLDVVDNVEDAIDKTLELRPQAVILDLKLNGSPGDEYLDLLKEKKLKENPSVFVLTANVDRATEGMVTSKGSAWTIYKSEPEFIKDRLDYVFKHVWKRYDFFEVKLNPGRLRPDPYESMEEKRERACELGLSYGAKRGGQRMFYFEYTIAEYSARGAKTRLNKILKAVGKELGSGSHTVYMGLREMMELMWKQPGKKDLKKEYEKWYHVSMDKGMPTLKELLLFLLEQF